MNLISGIDALGNDYVSKVEEAVNKPLAIGTDTEKESGDGTFDAIFNAVSGLVNDTNSYIQRAQQAEVDFALGKMTNTHELGVYQQQANIALQYTVAIRDKAIEAYRELMNMSI